VSGEREEEEGEGEGEECEVREEREVREVGEVHVVDPVISQPAAAPGAEPRHWEVGAPNEGRPSFAGLPLTGEARGGGPVCVERRN